MIGVLLAADLLYRNPCAAVGAHSWLGIVGLGSESVVGDDARTRAVHDETAGLASEEDFLTLVVGEREGAAVLDIHIDDELSLVVTKLDGLAFGGELGGLHLSEDLIDGLLAYVNLLALLEGEELARHTHLRTILTSGEVVGILPVAHPRDADDAALGLVAEGNSCIVVLAPVEPLDGLLRVVALEVLAVEGAYEIFAGRATEPAAWVDVDDHHILLQVGTLNREFEEVGALEHTRLGTVTVAESADIGPVVEVVGAEELHLVVGRNDYIVFAIVLEELGVAEVVAAVGSHDAWVVGELGVGAATIDTPCARLYLSTACRGVVAVDGVTLYDARTREDLTEGVAYDGWWEFGPMHHVGAHGVTPVHVAPLASVGVVLVEEMILTILVGHTVGVVHPAIGGAEMVGGTIVLAVGGVEFVAELQTGKCEGTSGEVLDLDASLLAGGQSHGNIVIDGIDGKTNVHPNVGFITGADTHQGLTLILLDRKENVAGWIGYVDNGYVALLRNSKRRTSGLVVASCEHQACTCCDQKMLNFHVHVLIKDD